MGIAGEWRPNGRLLFQMNKHVALLAILRRNELRRFMKWHKWNWDIQCNGLQSSLCKGIPFLAGALVKVS